MDVRIQTEQSELEALPEVKPPPLHKNMLVHGSTPAGKEVHIIFTQPALNQIRDHSASNLYVELGGVLLGKAYQYQGKVYVEVSAALPAYSDQNGPIHFTFTADAWARLHKERNELYPSLSIVGWFHTHPNLGVFYSSDDVVVHSVAFTMPWHIGLVVDPVRKESCIFNWMENLQTEEGRDLQPVGGYYEQTNIQPESVVAWEHVYRPRLRLMYDDMGPASSNVSNANQEAYIHYLHREIRLLNQYLMVGSAATFLVVLILLVGLFAFNGENERLQTLAIGLGQDKTALQTAQFSNSCPNSQVQIWQPSAGYKTQVGVLINIVGQANHTASSYYVLETRYLTTNTSTNPRSSWITVGYTSGGEAEQLGQWTTYGLLPGQYELRLRGVDENNHTNYSTLCTVPVTLVKPPPPTATPLPTTPATPPADGVPEPPSADTSSGNTFGANTSTTDTVGIEPKPTP